MRDAFVHLPAPHPETRLTVALPARDEAAALPIALSALASQVDDRGRRLRLGCFEVIVFANSCRDATAAIARAFAEAHPWLAIHVFEAELPRDTAHIGTARRAVMDAASERFERLAKPGGVIATTDADSVVDADWVFATLAEMARADAVTGRITLAPGELDDLPVGVRARYLLADAYHSVVAELEAIRDPVSYDPLPRHAQHVGASFAVSRTAYHRAGGLPQLPRMEDIEFYKALHRIDARVRHSPAVRVTTSARTRARVDGGLASRLAGYACDTGRFDGAMAEDPAYTLARIDARAALRRIWNGAMRSSDVARVSTTYGISGERFRRIFDADETFGENARRLESAGDAAFANPALVSMEVAHGELDRVRIGAVHEIVNR